MVIKMIAERSETMDVSRGLVFSLLMQEVWKKEIEEAIAKVKGDLPERKRQRHRRRKRGYWTPSGFAWFSRKQKWRYYGRHT